MRILLSNDDGYQARGLRMLADGLADMAEVTVVARPQLWTSRLLVHAHPFHQR